MTRDAPSEGRGLINRTARAFFRFMAQSQSQKQSKAKIKIKSKVKSKVKGVGPNEVVLNVWAST